MNWINRLQELGVTPLIGSEFSPLSETDVVKIERTLGERLPEDYRTFLLEYGSSDFEVYAVFPTAGGGIAPGTFFGHEIFDVLDELSERLPRRVLPINDDGAGNLLCISLRPDSFGAVCYQSHSIGWDDRNADEDSAKAATLVHVASSFASFINGLEVAE